MLNLQLARYGYTIVRSDDDAVGFLFFIGLKTKEVHVLALEGRKRYYIARGRCERDCGEGVALFVTGVDIVEWGREICTFAKVDVESPTTRFYGADEGCFMGDVGSGSVLEKWCSENYSCQKDNNRKTTVQKHIGLLIWGIYARIFRDLSIPRDMNGATMVMRLRPSATNKFTGCSHRIQKKAIKEAASVCRASITAKDRQADH